jgi:hypothetical protein
LTALRPLHNLFASGGTPERGEFKAMVGLGERTAGTVLKALLERRLPVSNSPQGSLRFGLPLLLCASTFRRCGPRPRRTMVIRARARRADRALATAWVQ